MRVFAPWLAILLAGCPGPSGGGLDDTAPADAAPADTAPADTGPADTAPGDTGAGDAEGDPDADAAPADTAPADTAPADTAPADTAPGDAGAGDALADAAPGDAGPDGIADGEDGAPDAPVPSDDGPESDADTAPDGPGDAGPDDVPPACPDPCPEAGATRCDGPWVQVCAASDGGCLAWGAPSPCGPGETCEGDACQPLGPPPALVINELVYDSAGSPDLDTFVELRGPAGTDLAGWTLVGVNGNGGKDYATIALAGTLDGAGLFVVAHPSAAPGIAAAADQTDADVDFQNAPDSVQLRFLGEVVDAVGYGTFGASDAFAGEGSPAPDAGPDQSLGRDALGTDTGDNAADFTVYATPTPGAPNAAAEPVASLACPPGGQVGEALTFDGSASTAAGGVVTYAFDFGDDSPEVTGDGDTASHAYAAAGDYTVTLEVADAAGATDSDACVVAIADPPDLPPEASLAASIVTELAVVLDAGASADAETPGPALEVRWDFEGDGTWDTGWSTEKTAAHTYPAAQAYAATVEVRDGAGQTDVATRTLPFDDVKTASGEVATATWTGVVLVTGDVTVPAGATLTVAAGTTVLFVFADTDVDGVGDHDLLVSGGLVVAGTEEAPVLFSSYGADKAPSRWGRVSVWGGEASATVAHALVEGADLGLRLGGVGSTVTDSTFARCGTDGVRVDQPAALARVVAEENVRDGVSVGVIAPVTLDRVQARLNGRHGVLVESAVNPGEEHVLTSSVLADNGGAGVAVGKAAVAITHCNISGNDVGVRLGDQAEASILATNITSNRREGVRLVQAPAAEIHGSNLHGNAVVSGGAFVTVGAQVVTTKEQIALVTGDPWTSPTGLPVRLFQWVFSENGPDLEEKAIIYAGSVEGPELVSTYGASGGVVSLEDDAVTTLVPQVWDNSFLHQGTLTLISAYVDDDAASTQLGGLLTAPGIDATGNYWGTFGDVPSALAIPDPAWVDTTGQLLGPAPDAGPLP